MVHFYASRLEGQPVVIYAGADKHESKSKRCVPTIAFWRNRPVSLESPALPALAVCSAAAFSICPAAVLAICSADDSDEDLIRYAWPEDVWIHVDKFRCVSRELLA